MFMRQLTAAPIRGIGPCSWAAGSYQYYSSVGSQLHSGEPTPLTVEHRGYPLLIERVRLDPARALGEEGVDVRKHSELLLPCIDIL